MDQFAKLGPVAALIKLWNELTPPQRVVVTTSAVLSIVLILIVAQMVTKPRMSVLFSGLGQEDAGAIVQKLAEQKVSYQLSGDGTTIEVPDGKVHELRLRMATQGLPQGGNVGFELFDKSSFGMTEFTEKLNYQRAIQGELTRTICQLAPVMGARVHVAMPEQNLYASEQEPTTSSVVLKLRRGMPLSDEQVGGIVHLVSSAVEGLRPNNVTVIDSAGNVLSEGPRTSGGGGGLMTSNQSKLKRQFESELAQNIQTMLAKTVGPDKAVVRVSAQLSFDQKQVKSESYLPAEGNTGPAKGVLLNEQTTTEKYNGAVMPMGGNVPAAGARGGGANDTYDRTESTAQYGVTKRIEETVSSPGQVQRLSVAVLVDEKVDPGKVGIVKEAVRTAAGIDEQRGDQITVERIAFDTVTRKAAEAEMASTARNDLIMAVAKNAGAVVLLVLFLLFLKRTIKQIRVQMPEPKPQPAMESSRDMAGVNPADLLQAMAAQGYSQPTEQTSGERFSTAKPDHSLPPEIEQSSPEDLARLVRTWMSEQ